MIHKKKSSLLFSIEKGVILGEVSLTIVLILVMSVSVFAQVVFRYFFEQPLSWTEEVSRYSLIWLMFIGASLAVRQKSHFVLEVFLHKLTGKIRVIADYALMVIMIIFISVLIYTGLILLPISDMQTSPALNISMMYVYLSVPVGGSLMLFHTIMMLIEKISPSKIAEVSVRSFNEMSELHAAVHRNRKKPEKKKSVKKKTVSKKSLKKSSRRKGAK